MRNPDRPNAKGWSETDWASTWKSENPWLVRISQLAGHNTAERLRIERECTYSEVAQDFKCMLAVSDFAWDKLPQPRQPLIIRP